MMPMADIAMPAREARTARGSWERRFYVRLELSDAPDNQYSNEIVVT